MNGQVLAQNPMWLISHDERRFIVHGSSDRMVKHSILDSYVLNPEAEIKGGMVLMDFEKSFPVHKSMKFLYIFVSIMEEIHALRGK